MAESSTPLSLLDQIAHGLIGDDDLVVVSRFASAVATDGVMASGSAVLSAASAPFASDHVGRAITISGAGAGGGKLRTTIASFTSASFVTLAENAAATTTGSSIWLPETVAATMLEFAQAVAARNSVHHSQSVAASTWGPISHGFGVLPHVAMIAGGVPMIPDVRRVDDNTIEIVHDEPRSGDAWLSRP